jgi:hypothetical protein
MFIRASPSEPIDELLASFRLCPDPVIQLRTIMYEIWKIISLLLVLVVAK